MVSIVKVIVLKLLAFKLNWDVDLLLGKLILAITQITTLNFAKKKQCYFGAWYPIAECANLKKNFKSKKTCQMK